MKTLPIDVSVGKGDAKVEDTFDLALPETIAEAIETFGEREVLRGFLKSYVIAEQAKARLTLVSPNGKSGKKARWAKELGV